jgi:hypothetical protein
VSAGCLRRADEARVASPAVESVHPVAIDADLPLKLIGAELAVQKNDLASAARRYADAAELSDDADIAEQATRLALAVKQWPLAHKSLARWQALDPKSVGLLQSRAWIALAEGEIEPAFAALTRCPARRDGPWRLAAQVMIGAGNKVRALPARTTGSTGASATTVANGIASWHSSSATRRWLVDSPTRPLPASNGRCLPECEAALDRGGRRRRASNKPERDPESLQLRSGYAAMLADSGDYAVLPGHLQARSPM